MKYKVIGWTEAGIGPYPRHKPNTEPVEQAIIADIRAHGYRFGGDRHEFYCPVLNDGTYVSYSWRGWGRVMARAWDMYEGGYDYMLFYMDEMIEEDYRVYPDTCVDDEQIVPREQLAETFFISLDSAQFEALDERTKRVDVRPFDGRIDIGDYIEFGCAESGERIKRMVTDIEAEPDFKRLLSYICLRYPPEALGFAAGTSSEKILRKTEERFPSSDGAMSIEFSPAEHTIKTCLYFRFDPEIEQNADIGRMILDFDCALNELWRFGGGWLQCGSIFRTEYNEEYDVDVNNMVRKTIADFVGREKETAQLQERLHGRIYLEILPRIKKNSSDPAPILSLDDDIIEFLYKSKIGMDMHYCIIGQENT